MLKLNTEVPRLLRATGIAVATAALLVAGSPAGAVTNCKAKVDKKTGVIKITALGADQATLLWGPTPSTVVNPFFDGSCIDPISLKARNCTLGDPMQLASKTPPPECTLYLNDVNGPCSVWIPGCVPGVRKGRAIVGYVWADQPSTASYTPDLGYQFNSTGATNTITRLATGLYQVSFPGIASATLPYNHVQVTEYNGTGTCRVGQWDSLSFPPDLTVYVDCRNLANVSTDSYFIVQVVE